VINSHMMFEVIQHVWSSQSHCGYHYLLLILNAILQFTWKTGKSRYYYYYYYYYKVLYHILLKLRFSVVDAPTEEQGILRRLYRPKNYKM
jgi:hypothetical protein